MERRRVLVTGCSSGIGRATARELALRGWQVFATARTEADLAGLSDEGLEAVALDYRDPDACAAAMEHVLQATGGRLDALVNNGAHAIPGALEDMPREALRAIFEANLFGWHDLTRRAIPPMRAQGSGRIVMVSSVLGMVAAPWRGAYNATKFALEGLTDTLRIEMRDTPIRVITVAPGPIDTPFRANSVPHFETWVDWEASPRAEQYRMRLLPRLHAPRGPARFQLPPEAVAAVIADALETRRPRARYHVTTPTRAMGLARRALPVRALDWILARG